MVYLDGSNHAGSVQVCAPESRGSLVLPYLTDVRGEQDVLVRVSWFG
jgi:hypothetical protein